MRRRQDDVRGLLIFCVDVHMELTSVRVHLSIHFDLINGWCFRVLCGLQPMMWGMMAHWQSRRLSSEGSLVRLSLQPRLSDLGQVLHSQLPVALRREIPAQYSCWSGVLVDLKRLQKQPERMVCLPSCHGGVKCVQ